MFLWKHSPVAKYVKFFNSPVALKIELVSWPLCTAGFVQKRSHITCKSVNWRKGLRVCMRTQRELAKRHQAGHTLDLENDETGMMMLMMKSTKFYLSGHSNVVSRTYLHIVTSYVSRNGFIHLTLGATQRVLC